MKMRCTDYANPLYAFSQGQKRHYFWLAFWIFSGRVDFAKLAQVMGANMVKMNLMHNYGCKYAMWACFQWDNYIALRQQ